MPDYMCLLSCLKEQILHILCYFMVKGEQDPNGTLKKKKKSFILARVSNIAVLLNSVTSYFYY